ncbi:FHA domain-containing protein [Luteitalea sp.]|jgi:DNA-binding winged helix-turn-helix (wHTH) protein|uniref:FHA domain-containing protein n=1 Tax=Luteitalea sp. TaxID=2004800 RepID=UPI0037C6036D
MKVAFGRFTFDSDTRELLDGETRAHLSPKAFDLLKLLLDRRPAVVSKRDIQEHLWPDTFVSEASLSVVVAEVRQVIGDDSRQASFIRTVHRIGYAFSGPAQDLARRPAGREATPLCWLVRDDRPVPLADGTYVIGRDPRSDVWVDASGVSRRHARLVVLEGAATVEDLESSNGTFVRGVRVTEPRALVDGDVIELGAAAITYRAWADAAAARTERVTRDR